MSWTSNTLVCTLTTSCTGQRILATDKGGQISLYFPCRVCMLWMVYESVMANSIFSAVVCSTEVADTKRLINEAESVVGEKLMKTIGKFCPKAEIVFRRYKSSLCHISTQ